MSYQQNMPANYPYGYQQNFWQYGYTLCPPTQSNNGDYNVVYNDRSSYENAANIPYCYQDPQQGTWDPNGYKQPMPVPPPPPPGTHEAPLPTPAPHKSVYKTQMFVKSKDNSTSSVAEDMSSFSQEVAASACARVHDLATFNNIKETYEISDKINGVFNATLKLGSEEYKGSGTSIKLAKQKAALEALEKTSLPQKKTLVARNKATTATSELHELAAKKGYLVDFKFLEPPNFKMMAAQKMWNKQELRGFYKVCVTVGGQQFEGTGEFPQESKHCASLLALPYLKSLEAAKSPKKAKAKSATVSPVQPASPQNVTEDSSASLNKNPLMLLNEIAMTRQMPLNWIRMDEEGPPHMRTFTCKLKIGDYEAVGTGANKKLAKNNAAHNMLQCLPDELKMLPPKSKKKVINPLKRKFPFFQHGFGAPAVPFNPANIPTPPKMPSVSSPPTNEENNQDLIGPKVPENAPLKKGGSLSGLPVHEFIKASNPISGLYEFCRKAKLPDPMFECIGETVLSTWQKGNHTFAKKNYDMKVEVMGKDYFASGNSKKVAKTKVAEQAWNIIRCGTFP